jgi:N-acetyl-gamma-glutamyl-phosphate reductase
VPLAQPRTPDEAFLLYQNRYAEEAFVRLLGPGEWPETRAVRCSNRCDLAVTTIHGGRTLLAAAAIDNLVKGAAGQAIQNLNLMLGWPESWGLPVHGSPW